MVPTPYEIFLLFEDGMKTCGVLMVIKKKFGRVSHMSSLMLFKVIGDSGRPHIMTYMQDETISHRKDLAVIFGALQTNDIYAKMK